MTVKAIIELDVNVLKALVNNDLDSSHKAAIKSELWRIAQEAGLVDERGNPIELL